jgi:DNA-binding transcriptional MerR regulator
MEGLTISQVARASHVNIETIRYYERRGLISKSPRSDSGYRMFS